MMILLEVALLVCILYLGIKASISDCQYSLIPNQLLIQVFPVVAALDTIYYGFFVRDIILEALFNLVFVGIFAVVFYAYNLWAAGDSKLLVLMTAAIPARIYSYSFLGPFPGFLCLVIIFSIAFIYVILESLHLGIKNGNLLQIDTGVLRLTPLILSYFFMVGAMSVCNMILWNLFGRILSYTGMFITAIDFLLVLSLRSIRDKLSQKQQILITIFIWGFLLISQFNLIAPVLKSGIDLKPWIIVFVVMFFRLISEKYNYQEISVDELKPRMIPSALTVISFRSSRVKGLPISVTEDLRARLTVEEIEAIKRWKNSKQGKDSIVIVRKIPFAIFISIGTFIFVIIEVLTTWHAF